MGNSRSPLSTKTSPNQEQREKAWNSGVKVGKKKPLSPKHASQIRRHLGRHESLRNQVLFALGYDTALRSSDLRSLAVSDVLQSDGVVRSRLSIVQRKTGQPVECVIGKETRKLLARFLRNEGKKREEPLFSGRTKEGFLSLRQHQRLVKMWVSAIGLRPEEYSSHTMRRTKASIVYAKSKNLEFVRLILGQRTIAAAAHYLGVATEQALAFSQKMSFGLTLKDSVEQFFTKPFWRRSNSSQFNVLSDGGPVEH